MGSSKENGSELSLRDKAIITITALTALSLIASLNGLNKASASAPENNHNENVPSLNQGDNLWGRDSGTQSDPNSFPSVNSENDQLSPVETPSSSVSILPVAKAPDIAPKLEVKPNLPGYSLQFPNLPGVTGHFFPEKEGFVKGFAVLNDKTSQMWTEYNKTGGYQKWGKAISTLWREADGKLRQAFEKGVLEADVDQNGQTIKFGEMNLSLEIARKKIDLEKTRPNPDVYGPIADKLSLLSLLPKIPNPTAPNVSGLSENIRKASDLSIIPQVAKAAVDLSAIQAQESLAQNPENMAQYWPLQVGNYWEYEGITKEGVVFHTRIEVEKELDFCGTRVYSLLFTKDRTEGYPFVGEDINLRWYIAKDFQWFGNKRYRFAKGDERFQRDSNELGKDSNIKKRTTLYHRLDPGSPAYMLFPEVVDGIPFYATQYYYASCDTNTQPWSSTWGALFNKKDNTTMEITYSEIDNLMPIPNPWAIEPYTFGAALGPKNIKGEAPSNRIFNMWLIKAFVQNPMLDGLLKNDTAGKYIYGNKDYKKINSKDLVITDISKKTARVFEELGFDEANKSGKFDPYKFAPYDKMAKASPLSRKNA